MAATGPEGVRTPPERPPGPPRPRSIFVPQEDPRRELRDAVDAILSDGFMAFLSALLVPIILLPLFVALPPTVGGFLNAGDVTIIAFFVVEYSAKLYLADDRPAYFRSPWHLLDLTVILLSFASYVPFLGLSGRGSAVLLVRLLRLPRVFAVAGRTAGSRLSAKDEGAPTAAVEPELRILRIDPTGREPPVALTWEELERHLASEAPEWLHLGNVSEAAARRLSPLLQIPEQALRIRQLDDLHPRAGHLHRTTLLFVQTGEVRYPSSQREFFTIARRGAVIALRGPKVLTISPHGVDAFEHARSMLRERELPPERFSSAVLEELLQAVLRDYRTLLTEIELEVSGIAATPRSHLPRDFLARAYQVNKATLRLASNVVHLRELLARLASGRVPVPGADASTREELEALGEETTYLSEIARDASESLKTVTDVYINQSSFETNRILKILAVITALALIPATVGGLLGIDGPYDFVLWQIVLVVSLGMVFAGYCFLKLGWLAS